MDKPAQTSLLTKDRTRLKGIRGLYRRLLTETQRSAVRDIVKSLRRQKRKPAPVKKTPLTKPKQVPSAVQVKPAPKPKPINSRALLTEANALFDGWRLHEALSKVNAAMQDGPNEAGLRLRASIHANLGDTKQAAADNFALLQINPIDVAGHRQLKALGELPPAPAMAVALAFIETMGGTPAAHLRAAEYLYFYEMFDELLQVCDMGLRAAKTAADPRNARTVDGLNIHKGYALEGTHQYDAAIELYEEMRGNSFDVKYVAPIARCLLELGRPDEGAALMRRAYASHPDPLPFGALNMDLLQARRLMRESYLLYRKRPISQALAKTFNAEIHPLEFDFLAPQNLHKKALLLAEGGPGDEMRLCSIYPELQRCFDHVTITCDPRLASILSRNFPKMTFLPTMRHRREIVRPMGDRTKLTDARLFQFVSDQVMDAAEKVDVVCSLLDSLADLRPDTASFTRNTRKLKPDSDLAERWAEKTNNSGRRKIGISWRSMLQSVARNRHYLTVGDLSPLSDIDADFWLLQPNATKSEIEHLQSFLSLHIPDGLDLVNDLEGQLALISNLDAVISPFTTTGEMAGAAGVPTILLSTTRSTTWRRNDDGSDIWHGSTQIVWGELIHEKASAVRAAAEKLERL